MHAGPPESALTYLCIHADVGSFSGIYYKNIFLNRGAIKILRAKRAEFTPKYLQTTPIFVLIRM